MKNNELLKLLGEDNEKEVKKTITKCIINRIEEIFDDGYVIDGGVLEESLEEVVKEVVADIIREDKDKIKMAINKKVKEAVMIEMGLDE